MRRRATGRTCVLLASAIGAGVLLGASASAALSSAPARVKSVYDGDTLTLADGQRVRLLQIDTPELGSGECYSRAAHRVLLSLVPAGSAVTVETDPALDRVDRYGRLLRYVYRGGLNVNLELVRRGAAAPYFYRGDRGRFASALLRAARAAKAARLGLWGACPRTVLAPDRQVDTGISGPPAKTQPTTTLAPVAALPPATPAAEPTTTSLSTDTPAPETEPVTPVGSPTNCAPSYPSVCIPPPPPDLDCADISFRRFAVRWDVSDPDPHHFDGDHDGVGCES